ncbi:hypothetical protein HGH92_25305 [Chitinophaga varians]|uniref:Uncharacterized protein n=1 Tax=Chitinophaga varians TaxID=2202339 RepID=A0A847S464_9BACT|nr:hypothetical protein [Chitinophaga varians]NLR67647.1 hypothetical protein [Chitinophaga varians]
MLNSTAEYLPAYKAWFSDPTQTDDVQIQEIDKTIAYLNTPDEAHLIALASNQLLPVPRSDFAFPASRITINYPGKDPILLRLYPTDTGVISAPFAIDTLGYFKAGQTFTFEITLVDKYKELVLDHFNKTHGYFQRDGEKNWHQLMKTLLLHTLLMDSVTAIMQDHADGKINDAAYKDSIQKRCTRINQVDKLLTQLKDSDNNRWLASWLWYTGGRPRFNPFDFSDGQPLKSYAAINLKADTSQYFDSFITAVNNAIEQQRLHPGPGSPDTILMLIEKKKQGEVKLVDKSASLSFIEKQNNKADAFSQSEKVLYKGVLLISTKDQLRYTRYHDRQKGYILSQKSPRDYPEDYAMHIGLVNIPGNKIVTLEQRLSDFTEKAEFSTQLQESLGALSTGKSTVTDAAKVITAFLATAENTAALHAVIKKAAAMGGAAPCIYAAQHTWELYHFVKTKYNGDLPVPEKLTPQTDSSQYQYTTILAGQDDKAAPFTNEYSIIERLASDTSKKQIAKGFHYNVGKLRSFAIGAGLAFGFSQVRQVNVDSVGALSTTTDAARAKFIVGLKYYPFKTFLRDNGICPRWPERRFSLFGGFEVLDPLNNLYLGIGYDIVPGLNVNAGANFYRQNYYRIQNDRILDKATRMPAVGYLAVTLDPEVVVDLIKLMAK